MPIFSAFTGFGHLRFSSTDSYARTIYDDIVAKLGGDGKNYDLSQGTHEQAKTYARAMHYARIRGVIERAGAQKHPMTCIELLPVLEYEYGLIPGPKDTILDRQKALAAIMLAPGGAILSNLETLLTNLLGSSFLGIRTIHQGEASVWPSTMGSVGQFPKDLSIPKKVFLLQSPIAVTGQPVTFMYQRPYVNDDGIRLAVGDTVTVDTENQGLTENVTIAAIYPGQGALQPLTKLSSELALAAVATFANAHSAPNPATGYLGASLIVGPAPALVSSQRYVIIVGTSAAVSDAETRRKVNDLCRRTLRGVDQWAFVEASASHQIGPFTVGQTPIGTAPIGTASF